MPPIRAATAAPICFAYVPRETRSSNREGQREAVPCNRHKPQRLGTEAAHALLTPSSLSRRGEEVSRASSFPRGDGIKHYAATIGANAVFREAIMSDQVTDRPLSPPLPDEAAPVPAGGTTPRAALL